MNLYESIKSNQNKKVPRRLTESSVVPGKKPIKKIAKGLPGKAIGINESAEGIQAFWDKIKNREIKIGDSIPMDNGIGSTAELIDFDGNGNYILIKHNYPNGKGFEYVSAWAPELSNGKLSWGQGHYFDQDLDAAKKHFRSNTLRQTVYESCGKKKVRKGKKLNEADGWIAMFGGKKCEIGKDEAKDLWGAKQIAIKKLNVPKSRTSQLAIEPAYNDDNLDKAPASNAQFEAEENKYAEHHRQGFGGYNKHNIPVYNNKIDYRGDFGLNADLSTLDDDELEQAIKIQGEELDKANNEKYGDLRTRNGKMDKIFLDAKRGKYKDGSERLQRERDRRKGAIKEAEGSLELPKEVQDELEADQHNIYQAGVNEMAFSSYGSYDEIEEFFKGGPACQKFARECKEKGIPFEECRKALHDKAQQVVVWAATNIADGQDDEYINSLRPVKESCGKKAKKHIKESDRTYVNRKPVKESAKGRIVSDRLKSKKLKESAKNDFWSSKRSDEVYALYQALVGSDNLDYIKEQLDKIYAIAKEEITG